MSNQPIGIFDSGVGGLTVMSEIIRQLPKEKIIYFGDNLHLPYGPRDLSEVRSFVFQIITYLQLQDVKLVIIACNTATAAGLVEAQQHFSLPIVGVIEPSARGAVMATKNRRIGVIGTEGTIKSGAYDKAIMALDAGIAVHSVACPRFVEIIESGIVQRDNISPTDTFDIAKGYLEELLRNKIDSLILGCTHYPFLKDILQNICGNGVILISSAEETAAEVETILERRGQLREEASEPKYRFVVTGDAKRFRTLGSGFLGRDIDVVEKIDLQIQMKY